MARCLRMQAGLVGLLFVLVLMWGFIFQSSAVESAELPPVNSTLGVRGGDATMEGYVDLIGPVWAPVNGVLFLNPRVSLRDEGENEVNLGLGYRHLIPSQDIVLGINGYFDSRESKWGNRFNQFGAGVEFLSKWVDARANYYLPEDQEEVTQGYWQEEVDINSLTKVRSKTKVSWRNIRPTEHKILGDGTWKTTTTSTTTTTTTTTRKLFEQFEAGLEGWDAEIGGRLPIPDTWPEMRLFAGYYDFEGAFGEGIEGFKGRFEMRTGPYLTFDAEIFEDKELNGTDYFVGVRLQIPFTGVNPFSNMDKLFAPVVRTQRERLHREMVMRDVRIQMEESNFIEDPSKKAVDVDVKVDVDKDVDKETKRNIVLARNITFVEGDDTGGLEDGTYENPYNELQEASNQAGNNNKIFVFDAASDYAGVRLQNNQILTSAVDLRYHGQMVGTYAPDPPPTVNGFLQGSPTGILNFPAAVELAGNNTIRRINMTGPVGIRGFGTQNATIRDVRISETGVGILILGGSGTFNITNTTVEDTFLMGLGFVAGGNSVVNVSNSRFDDILGVGAAFVSLPGSPLSVNLTNNYFNTLVDGLLFVSAGPGSSLNATMRNNTINSFILGAGAVSIAGADMNLNMTGNRFGAVEGDIGSFISSVPLLGIIADQGPLFGVLGVSMLDADLNLTMNRNTVNSLVSGVTLVSGLFGGDPSTLTADIRSNTINSWISGITAVSLGNSTLTANIGSNTINSWLLGIGALSAGTSTLNANITGNTITGRPLPLDFLIPGLEIPGILGIGSVALGSSTTNLTVRGNTIDEFLIGMVYGSLGGTMNENINANQINAYLLDMFGF